MRKLLIAVGFVAATSIPFAASAHTDLSIGIGIGGPVYYEEPRSYIYYSSPGRHYYRPRVHHHHYHHWRPHRHHHWRGHHHRHHGRHHRHWKHDDD